jgi:hypothetical protein
MTPPTSGLYKGLTLFQQRSKDVPVNVQGNGSSTYIAGTFYAAGGLMSIAGNGGVSNIGSQYISRALNLSGNGDILITWNPQFVAARRFIGLVE